MFFILIVICLFNLCSAGDVPLTTSGGKMANLFNKKAISSLAPQRSLSAPSSSAIIRSNSAGLIKNKGINNVPLKIDNAMRSMHLTVAKVKSSENVPEYHGNKQTEQQQFQIPFLHYYEAVNAHFIGKVPKKVIAKIAVNLLETIQRHLANNDNQLPYVLKSENFVVIRTIGGDQFTPFELIGNVRVEIEPETVRVADPRQRTLPVEQQSKIIWLREFVYMSPQQIKDNNVVSGEKDIVWSFGVILYEMVHGYNPFWDIKNTIQPKKQWHWIPLNDEKGEMSEAIKKINEEQMFVKVLRDSTLTLVEKNVPLVTVTFGEQFESVLKACLENDAEKRITLSDLLQIMKQTIVNANIYFFEDRQDAGKKLAKVLSYLDQMREDIVVLAIPRGGVPVAYEIAKSLKAPLGLLFTKKIGHPNKQEYGIAVIVDGNPPTKFLPNKLSAPLHLYTQTKMHQMIVQMEQQKKKFLKNDCPQLALPLDGRVVVVVDDGMATGLSAQAALAQLQDKNAALVMFASPVCPLETVEKLQKDGMKIVCLETPPNFDYVSRYYKRFDQTTDQEVIHCLDSANEWMKKTVENNVIENP